MKRLILLLGIMAVAASARAITCPSGSAFELRRPSDNISLGCITGSSGAGRFAVSSTTFNGVDQNWPISQGGASTVLTNDGSGNLSWASASGGIMNSSYTSNMTTTNMPAGAAGFSTCVTGSTVSLTTTGYPVTVTYSGTYLDDSGSANINLSFLMDGTIPAGTSTTAGVIEFSYSNGANTVVGGSYSYTFVPSAATHSFCLTGRAGTAGHIVKLPQVSGATFGVREEK